MTFPTSGARSSICGRNENKEVHRQFVDAYTRALIDRDASAIADHYAVPALIEFPGQWILVTDAAQTESFFASAFEQYSDVTEVDADVTVTAATGHSIWADVTWRFRGGAPDERNMYQLVSTEDGWKIAVLTPVELG
ncbi:SnoaL-like domain-containing protein [Brevibacterium siliguriense]|uniref:SnoaL-like domain-containing protein n=1 Tax=Brevibacterium siliguriense TaxID=1136497 RepID=A0A1H1LTM9_9MICO|nr:nuclear transport factor 2 family protein [Brevibacterium siliguriense]SDR77906.1 SnoaL-like domain-containing protein [Brevibacterium siliguriense]